MKMRLSTRLTIGLVLFFVFCLFAMVIPALLEGKQNQQRIQTSNDLKMLTLSVLVYATDNDGKLPDSNKWADQLCLVLGTNKEPSMDPFYMEKILNRKQCGYAINSAIAGKKLNDVLATEPAFFPVVHRGRNLSIGTNDMAAFAWDKRGALKVVTLEDKVITLERQNTGKR